MPDFKNPVEPLQGPDVPYKAIGTWDEPLWGKRLFRDAHRVHEAKWRKHAWRLCGFGHLRRHATLSHIQAYKPLHDPEIVPLANQDPKEDPKEEEEEDLDDEAALSKRKKYWLADDYREQYLSGRLTPTDVLEVLIISLKDGYPNPHGLGVLAANVKKVREEAYESTWRYRYKCSLGPLDGVPTVVKDDCDMDGHLTRVGSRYCLNRQGSQEWCHRNWTARKLLDAGAIIIGKTLMDEFGLGTTGNNPNIKNPRNPYNYNYYTGGSSSGIAYLVSAGLIPFGLGSDGGGRIRIPASFCGVFGFKPTHGRILSCQSLTAHTTCTSQGLIAVDIKSLATVLEIISEPHPDSRFPPLERLILRPVTSFPSKKYLGIPVDWVLSATPEIRALFKSFVETLDSEPYNYTPVNISIPFLAQGQIAHATTFLAETAGTFGHFAWRQASMRLPSRIQLAIGGTIPRKHYILAQKMRRLLMQHLAWLWKQYPGMIILTPTTACGPLAIRKKIELKYGLHDGGWTTQSMRFAWLANFCGLPSLSVPMGFVPPSRALIKRKKRKEEPKEEPKEEDDEEVENDDDWIDEDDESFEAFDSYWDLHLPVGLMATGKWASEEQLLQFGLVAEKISGEAALRKRPPGDRWVDVLGRVAKGLDQ